MSSVISQHTIETFIGDLQEMGNFHWQHYVSQPAICADEFEKTFDFKSWKCFYPPAARLEMEVQQTQTFTFPPTPLESSPLYRTVHPKPSMTPKVGYFSLTFHKVMFFSTSSSIFQHFFGYTWSRLVEEREHRLDQDATLQKEQQKEKLEIATAGQREQKMMEG